MHPAVLNISYKTSFGRDNNNYDKFLYRHTRIIILPMVVTIFASQVCSAPLLDLFENRERESYNT